MKVALSYLTRNQPELIAQTAPRLPFDHAKIFSIDGSDDDRKSRIQLDLAFRMFGKYPPKLYTNVRGGADSAIIFALTEMLNDSEKFDVVGLCESDVLLHDGWFEKTIALFNSENLEVGAVSPRSYVDRVLIQRDGYAVMHNLGAGVVLFTRQAAEVILANYRTGWWTDNRAIFEQLCNVDIGHFGAFRGNQQWTSVDWHWDAVLAQHGLASLALTPAMVSMVGQEPPLAEQGLELTTGPVEARCDDITFERFSARTKSIRETAWRPNVIAPIHRSSISNSYLYFAHQLPYPRWSGDWRLQWSQGFGPFAWRAGSNDAKLTVSLYGPVVFLASGGKNGGKIKIVDTDSGYEINPDLPANQPQNIHAFQVPAGVSYRQIEMTCSEGVVFYGVQTTEPQPTTSEKFDYSKLPPV